MLPRGVAPRAPRWLGPMFMNASATTTKKSDFFTQNYEPIHTKNDTQLQTQQILSRQGPLSTRAKRTAEVLTDDDDSIFSAIEVDEKIEQSTNISEAVNYCNGGN